MRPFGVSRVAMSRGPGPCETGISTKSALSRTSMLAGSGCSARSDTKWHPAGDVIEGWGWEVHCVRNGMIPSPGSCGPRVTRQLSLLPSGSSRPPSTGFPGSYPLTRADPTCFSRSGAFIDHVTRRGSFRASSPKAKAMPGAGGTETGAIISRYLSSPRERRALCVCPPACFPPYAGRTPASRSISSTARSRSGAP